MVCSHIFSLQWFALICSVYSGLLSYLQSTVVYSHIFSLQWFTLIFSVNSGLLSYFQSTVVYSHISSLQWFAHIFSLQWFALIFSVYSDLLSYFQSTVICSPKDGEYGGIPAGCQCDLDNNIWIADMRLGILKMDQSGKCQQVHCKKKELVLLGIGKLF